MAEEQLDVDDLINRMATKHGVAVAQATIAEMKADTADRKIRELVRLLVEHGVDPDTGESLPQSAKP